MRRHLYVILSITGIIIGLISIALSAPPDPYQSGSVTGYIFGGLLILFGVVYLFKKMFTKNQAVHQTTTVGSVSAGDEVPTQTTTKSASAKKRQKKPT